MSAIVAAQALAAFHGRPEIAYHEKGQIWESDEIYAKIFPEDRINAGHMLFTYSLLRAVEQQKLDLNAIPDDRRTDDQRALSRWFALRGSTFLAATAIGSSIEAIMGKAVPDRYTLRFKRRISVAHAIARWAPVVSTALTLAPDQLSNPLTGKGLRDKQTISTAVGTYRSLISLTAKVNTPIYASFSEAIATSS